jgi:putative membrane protein
VSCLLVPFVGETLLPRDLWTAWNFEPSLLLPLALYAFVYAWGMRNVWHRAGHGHGISVPRSLCSLGAVLALLTALASPLDGLSEVLFSAHMLQHLVLILIAAPLLALSNFPLAFLWALPRAWARVLGQWINRCRGFSQAWRVISSPLCTWFLFAILLWAWHTPLLFEAALQHEPVHAFEHLCFVLSALLFWQTLFEHTHLPHNRYGIAVPFLFTTALHSGVLGALLTFSAQPWYPDTVPLVSSWGVDPLQDQQLAGLIMWLPGGIVYNLLTIWYFGAWLRSFEPHQAHAALTDPSRANTRGNDWTGDFPPVQSGREDLNLIKRMRPSRNRAMPRSGLIK